MTMSHVDSVGRTLAGREAGGDLSTHTVFAYELPLCCRVIRGFEMDRFALAKAMKEMARRTDACWRPADIIQHHFAGAPFGSAYVCISPGEQSEFASSNHNRSRAAPLVRGRSGWRGGAEMARVKPLDLAVVQAWLSAWNERDIFSDAAVRHLQSLIMDPLCLVVVTLGVGREPRSLVFRRMKQMIPVLIPPLPALTPTLYAV